MPSSSSLERILHNISDPKMAGKIGQVGGLVTSMFDLFDCEGMPIKAIQVLSRNGKRSYWPDSYVEPHAWWCSVCRSISNVKCDSGAH
jgi:hypothetical protein